MEEAFSRKMTPDASVRGPLVLVVVLVVASTDCD